MKTAVPHGLVQPFLFVCYRYIVSNLAANSCVTICMYQSHQPQGEDRHRHSYGQIHVDRVRCTLSA